MGSPFNFQVVLLLIVSGRVLAPSFDRNLNNTMLEVTIPSIEHHCLVNRDCHVIEHHTRPETNNVVPESRPNPENKTDLPTT